ncbi:zinc metallochaperone AztD [Rhodococcus daqingensis]|uniref:Zinc metallochaperone AztD n=1 Tax=Rhodococcus daqingensis TaxID=2479363 RepID=A0ABW2RXN0_9NOCA
MTQTLPARSRAAAASAALATVLLAGCSSGIDSDRQAVVAEDPETAAPVEASHAVPRLAVSYAGGVLVLDAASLEVVGQVPVDGFTRLNPAGDGRHVLVTAADAFRVLDVGTWSEPHGDHSHHYTSAPAFTGTEFAARKPGHVVRHAGRTALFHDGSGLVETFDPRGLADGKPAVDSHTTAEPHHGVAVELANGGLITTLGNEEERTGIVVLDRDRREVARDERCPGVHGEAAAANEVILFGCQDGALVYRDGLIAKITSPDAYGRIGNQAGAEASDVVLGDYKTDRDAELERPQRVMLVNTTTAALTPVDLGTSYTFRSLGRGPRGEALVLGTDGRLHVIDQNTGAVTNRIPVLGVWSEPDEWQSPRPALFVDGGTAYVSDPATSSLHAVDLGSGAVVRSTVLPQSPIELTGVSG